MYFEINEALYINVRKLDNADKTYLNIGHGILLLMICVCKCYIRPNANLTLQSAIPPDSLVQLKTMELLDNIGPKKLETPSAH